MRVPIKSNNAEGTFRASHWGGLSFGYFSLATQRKVTRYQAKKIFRKTFNSKTSDKPDYPFLPKTLSLVHRQIPEIDLDLHL